LSLFHPFLLLNYPRDIVQVEFQRRDLYQINL
jgi:hypothetical protein